MSIDIDEVTEEAIAECVTLLDGAQGLAVQMASSRSQVDEIYRKIHTVKSNVAFIPNTTALSLLIQNLESTLSKVRNQTMALSEGLIDQVLNSLSLAIEFLNTITKKQSIDLLEPKIYKQISSLRTLR